MEWINGIYPNFEGVIEILHKVAISFCVYYMVS